MIPNCGCPGDFCRHTDADAREQFAPMRAPEDERAQMPERRSAYRKLLDTLGLRRTGPQRAQHPERDLSGH